MAPNHQSKVHFKSTAVEVHFPIAPAFLNALRKLIKILKPYF